MEIDVPPPGQPDRGWALTSQSLDRLLNVLGPDRERAAEAYDELRRRIVGLMEWWGSNSPDELADETLDRVARKLEEGAVIPDGSLGAYVRGVARMIFYEASRRPRMLTVVPERALTSTDNPDEAILSSLDRCLDRLSAADRNLVLRYYGDGKPSDNRQALAVELGISPTALRVRAHRLRQQLERGVRADLSIS